MIKTVKKIISYIMVCVLFLSMCIPCEAAQTSTATASDANATTGFPQITSTSAIIMDAQSGQIIYEKNSHTRQYPAVDSPFLQGIQVQRRQGRGPVVGFPVKTLMPGALGETVQGISVQIEEAQSCLPVVCKGAGGEGLKRAGFPVVERKLLKAVFDDLVTFRNGPVVVERVVKDGLLLLPAAQKQQRQQTAEGNRLGLFPADMVIPVPHPKNGNEQQADHSASGHEQPQFFPRDLRKDPGGPGVELKIVSAQIKRTDAQGPGGGEPQKIFGGGGQEGQRQQHQRTHQRQRILFRQYTEGQDHQTAIEISQFLQGKLQGKGLPQGHAFSHGPEAHQRVQTVIPVGQPEAQGAVGNLKSLNECGKPGGQRQSDQQLGFPALGGAFLLGQQQLVHLAAVFLAEQRCQQEDQRQPQQIIR